MTLLDKVPGLRQALENEQAARNQSFLGLPEVLCGIEVEPLTLRKMLLLSEAGSTFITGGAVEPYDIAAFVVSVSGKKGFAKWRLLRRIGRTNADDLLKGIESYLDETFMDAPPSGRGGGKNYFSMAAGVVDIIASEYGWPEEKILDMPLKRIFQYVKAIVRRKSDVPLFNKSDRLITNWLREVNTKRN